ncbi:hypothetical protein [Streptosporangium sp. NPDC002721]|uniref:hypothetical protein n=1 Tax=Streptosporangium sp. NPDC002721 TaxID=3366188 RepID=UPI0036BF429F
MTDLSNETWIGPYPGNLYHDVIAPACEYAGFAYSSDGFSAVVALAAASSPPYAEAPSGIPCSSPC